MEHLRIVKRVNNLEIISKLLDSVAKQYDCKVTYCADEGALKFHGAADYQKPIMEQALSFFKAA